MRHPCDQVESKPLGVVVIGRNEGERLTRCLESIAKHGFPIVYADSGSTDGSIAQALSIGADVIELDMSTPFSAARARNEGFERLIQTNPGIKWVQFVDGDCEMIDNWFGAAVESAEAEGRLGAVCGILHERFPEASLYNRICDIEWPREVGEVNACGGIFVVRVEAFERVGRFDATVPAGEEPELCQRLRADGWTVRRIDEPMCWHDSAMHRFSQWWRRQVRTGYSGWDVARRFGGGPDRPFVRSVRSTRLWTLAIPLLATTLGLLIGAVFGGWIGIGTATLILTLLPLQAGRITLRSRRRGMSWAFACSYGALTMVGKFAQLYGQCRYALDLVGGRGARVVAHKSAGTGQIKGAAGR